MDSPARSEIKQSTFLLFLMGRKDWFWFLFAEQRGPKGTVQPFNHQLLMIDGAAVPLVFDGMIGLVCLWLHWWVSGRPAGSSAKRKQTKTGNQSMNSIKQLRRKRKGAQVGWGKNEMESMNERNWRNGILPLPNQPSETPSSSGCAASPSTTPAKQKKMKFALRRLVEWVSLAARRATRSSIQLLHQIKIKLFYFSLLVCWIAALLFLHWSKDFWINGGESCGGRKEMKPIPSTPFI